MTKSPVQDLLAEMYIQLGDALVRRAEITRAHDGDEEMLKKHGGRGLHDHNGERLCESMLAMMKAHTP